MSRLDELIQELCPDGVEYDLLKNISEMQRGTSLTKKNATSGNIPVVSGGREPAFYCDTNNRDGETITVAGSGAGAGYVQYWIEPIFVSDAFSVKSNEKTTTKYLYYCLEGKQDFIYSTQKGGGVPHVHISSIENMKLPVPPLEVQREIVRILDSFTLLTAELTAELKARKKQYEFYRDKLLTFDNVQGGGTSDVVWRTLGDICTLVRGPFGGSLKKECFVSDGYAVYEQQHAIYDDFSNFRYFIDDTKYAELKRFSVNPGDMIMSCSGTMGKIAIVPDDAPKGVINQALLKITVGPEVDRKYLKYCFENTVTKQMNDNARGGAIKNVASVAELKQTMIAVPPIEAQKRLVHVLDNFDAICSDLNVGLPAEIEARQKQYEYYRDALLTYAATGKIIPRQTDRQTDRHNALIKLCQYVFGVVLVKLSDIAMITRGGNFQKKDFTDTGVPCIHYGQMYTHFGIYATEPLKYISEDVAKKSKIAVKNDIVMAVTSENVEDVCKCTAWLGNENIAVSGHTAIIHHNQNAKYLSYYFHTAMFFAQKKRLAHGTKVIEVTPNTLNDIVIPLPSLAEQ